MTDKDYGPLRTFGRRQGHKLKPRQQALVDSLLPEILVDVPDQAELDPAALFAHSPKELWFEIGFGGGEHAARQAMDNPDVGIFACEPFMNGVASLLVQIDENNIQNIRLLNDDARPLLNALPDGCLDRVFLLFPDPWPKVRHHKRRFVSPENLDSIARLLKTGGEFRFGSDHMNYVRWTLDHLLKREDFKWLAEGPDDWRLRPDDWPPTRYEQKALRKGDKCAYLRFKRL